MAPNMFEPVNSPYFPSPAQFEPVHLATIQVRTMLRVNMYIIWESKQQRLQAIVALNTSTVCAPAE